MNFRSAFEFLGGGVLVLFGLLFFVYLPHDIYDVTTNVIFIVFGLIFVRKGILDQRQSPQQPTSNKKDNPSKGKMNPPSQQGGKKSDGKQPQGQKKEPSG